MNYYLQALKNYAKFDGRARRKEYWMFVLFYVLFFMVAVLVDIVAFKNPGIFTGLYVLAMIIPMLAVEVRRLHDVGKSGWFIFIRLIPLIGGIWLLVLLCTEGERGVNQYGTDPKTREPQPQMA